MESDTGKTAIFFTRRPKETLVVVPHLGVSLTHFALTNFSCQSDQESNENIYVSCHKIWFHKPKSKLNFQTKTNPMHFAKNIDG